MRLPSGLLIGMIIPHLGAGQPRIFLKQAWTLRTIQATVSSSSFTAFGYYREGASSFARLWAPALGTVPHSSKSSNAATIAPLLYNLGKVRQQRRHFRAATRGNMSDKAAWERLEEGARAPRGGGQGKRGGRGGGGAPDREVLISKALSALLRHKASDAGIDLDGEGFARLDQVVSELFLCS